jgi:MinD-like ATPase involved in chromosome partitioning or flagellar assembly
MYTVTFYSFKGGVGRTQALVNVGVHLALSGKRVLLVDFDLEAPGLATFDLGGESRSSRGIVEFVTEYRSTMVAPDVRNFVFEVPLSGSAGALWVMPAGRDEPSYSTSLHSIDWGKLYRNESGYLLFEDLKLQWQSCFEPDYVLVDSRTGFTDVGGICTRQLPDSVVIVFFPTDQHLIGLPKVVRDIRDEGGDNPEKRITSHFVMANVPNLDDEDDILARRLRQFEEALDFTKLAATIHRYDSLALLDQTVFTQHRPKTRLAREYRELTSQIQKANVGDRDGALEYINEMLTSRVRDVARRDEVEKRLQDVAKTHAGDHAILSQISLLEMRGGRFSFALPLLDRALDLAPNDAELIVRRADCRLLMGDKQGAVLDATQLLSTTTADWLQISRALSLLLSSEAPVDINMSPVIPQLASQEKLWIVEQLKTSYQGLRVAEDILRSHATAHPGHEMSFDLSLVLIGRGDFGQAVELLDRLRGASRTIIHVFNYAVAVWGLIGEPDIEAFTEVVALASGSSRHDANFKQCIALAAGMSGDLALAMRLLKEAQDSIQGASLSFSCWRYLNVTEEEFLTDLALMREFLETGGPLPTFMTQQINLPM